MNMVNDAVIAKPTFEKVADTKLSDDSTKWHEEILQKFFEEVDYLPQDIGTDIVLSSVDTNKGYGKGSVVVWLKDKKINFPIIIRDYKMSPFDVFVAQDGDAPVYMPASFENVKSAMSSTELGSLQNIWDKGNVQLNGIKTPGGVYPKQQVDVSNGFQAQAGQQAQPFFKSSGWRDNAKKEDLEKFAAQMEQDPGVHANYVDNTGDLVTNVIDLAHGQKKVIADTNSVEDINLNGLINAKQALTVIDAELFDVNKLEPVLSPSACELRVYEYPTMEDFIERGDNAGERYMASKNGRSVVGVVLDIKDANDSDDKHQDKIFISMDGKSFSRYRNWGDEKEIGFYGSKIVPVGGSNVDKVLKVISANTSDEFTSFNRKDGSDKLFNPVKTLDQGRDSSDNDFCVPSYGSNSLIVIYGAGDLFECVSFGSNYRKISVNGSPVYTSGKTAIVPANVASVQRVSGVENEVYRMATLDAKSIYLIPETSIVFNTEYMKEYNKNEFLRPSLPLQKVYEDSNISKVAVEINPDGGYTITGEPYEGLAKIAGKKCLTTKNAISALTIMGMEKEAASTVLKHAVNRYIDKEASDKKVTVYGVRGDYINTEFSVKVANDTEILKKMAALLRKDLTKEASVITDPEAADVVLSLNFINEDSLRGYVENIDEMRRTLSQLSQMVIASRLGLSDLDESALEKSIQGLDDVVKGLENIKLAIK